MCSPANDLDARRPIRFPNTNSDQGARTGDGRTIDFAEFWYSKEYLDTRPEVPLYATADRATPPPVISSEARYRFPIARLFAMNPSSARSLRWQIARARV